VFMKIIDEKHNYKLINADHYKKSMKVMLLHRALFCYSRKVTNKKKQLPFKMSQKNFKRLLTHVRKLGTSTMLFHTLVRSES